MDTSNNQALAILKQYWGYESFRPYQLEVIESVLTKPYTFGLLTTGAGKSICFQVPAMMLPGACLVFSPLVALMKDQVMALRQKKIPAAMLYSNMDKAYENEVYQGLADGKIKFLYIAPERLSNLKFQEILSKTIISLIAIDEAHCISQWGNDFRPSYAQISQIKPFLPNHTKIVCLTATATPQVIGDIQSTLQVEEFNLIKSSFFKPNLHYQVIYEDNKIPKLIQWLKNQSESGIIYASYRKQVEILGGVLSKSGIKTFTYHAGMKPEIRHDTQAKWLKSDQSVMVCTNAFGMGIDNPNIQFVAHVQFPYSLESYFQEIGRAGRDGRQAMALTLINEVDFKNLEESLQRFPTIKDVMKFWKLLYLFLNIVNNDMLDETHEFKLEHLCERYNLDNQTTGFSLRILEEHKIISYYEVRTYQSLLRLILPHEQIDDFQDQPYFDFLQKLYSYAKKSYQRVAPFHLESFCEAFQFQISTAYKFFRILNQQNIVYFQKQYYGAKIKVNIPKDRLDLKLLNQQIIEERANHYRFKIQQCIDFLKEKEICRSVFLLNYFGETNASPCGQCDICHKSKSQQNLQIDLSQLILEILDWQQVKTLNDIHEGLHEKYTQVEIKSHLAQLIERKRIQGNDTKGYRLK
ncbi:MAG: RecQ family ATP-dependent DNA helicase [Chitinophagales bacterium]|jgi:ATP-dependent DNA helicase RecQ|nr:RecQ family ATP-dependent DNA helicase [Chitinophagales bacterium]